MRLSLGMSTPTIRGMGFLSLSRLSLTLLVARVGADDSQHSPPPDDLAVLADPLDRYSHFHVCLVRPFTACRPRSVPRNARARASPGAPPPLFTVDDPPLGEVVGRDLQGDPITGENPDEVHPHFPRDVSEDHVP